MALVCVTPASLYPVTTAEAKLACRQDDNAFDTAFPAWIAAAVQECESITRAAVMPQTWRLLLDAWPTTDGGIIRIPKGPNVAITGVQYAHPDTGAMTTLDTSAYQVDVSSPYAARLAPAYLTGWPTTRSQMAAVQVTFTCGYASAEAVPSLIKQWVLMRVAAYRDNPAAFAAGATIERPTFVDGLLDPYVIPAL